MKVLYLTTTGDDIIELPTPLDIEGYLCGIVELAGKVVNLKGDLFLCCDFCEESVIGEIKIPVLRCIKRKQTGIVYNDINPFATVLGSRKSTPHTEGILGNSRF